MTFSGGTADTIKTAQGCCHVLQLLSTIFIPLWSCVVWRCEGALLFQKAVGVNNKATAIAVSEMGLGSFSATEASRRGMTHCYFIKLTFKNMRLHLSSLSGMRHTTCPTDIPRNSSGKCSLAQAQRIPMCIITISQHRCSIPMSGNVPWHFVDINSNVSRTM